jgi:cytochrome c peroxidase
MSRKPWRWVYLATLVVLAILVAIGWQHQRSLVPIDVALPNLPETVLVNEPIQPLPLAIAFDVGKASLGERLFQDPQLSIDNRVSCLSCHKLDRGGADSKALSVGANGILGKINTPSVYNAEFNAELTWNGKFKTLEEFTQAVIQNPTAMGIQWQVLMQKLQQVPEYQESFARLYPEGISIANTIDALAVYQRSLYTPNSPFDRYLRGDRQAINEAEKEGYQLFKNYGCVSCHQGVNVGGNLYQKFGTMGDYFSRQQNRKITTADLGRYNITKNSADRFVFRVPSLRNVALTAPYFHDGSARTLEEAIAIMADFQLGRSLSTKDTAKIAQFLQTLTGEPPKELVDRRS